MKPKAEKTDAIREMRERALRDRGRMGLPSGKKQGPMRKQSEPTKAISSPEWPEHEPLKTETPDMVWGRLSEAAHVHGYTGARAASALEWLVEGDRWTKVGPGFADGRVFLSTINVKEFRLSLEMRKKLVKKLYALPGVTQRAVAKAVGVGHGTVERDLAPNGAIGIRKAAKNQSNERDLAPNGATSLSQSGSAAAEVAEAEAERQATEGRREEDRQRKRDERLSRPMPEGKFKLLYADPPWQYEYTKAESRAIENQYPTMSLEEICAFKAPAADDAVLFLWATSPKLGDAMKVIEAWGFNYRTCAVWDKGVIEMGYYFRQQHELLLVAKRGDLPTPEPPNRPSSVIYQRRGKHSEKPVVVYELLAAMYPSFGAQDRIELFSRSSRENWTTWGNEAKD